MSTSVDHAVAVLAGLPVSEWNNAIEKAIALRKERERCSRDLEEAERSLPHKLPSSSEFSSFFYMIVMLISHCSHRYVKTIFQQLSSHIVAPRHEITG